MSPTADDPEMLQRALDALPAPAEPLDVVMVDGFVCALQLRKQVLADAFWLRWVLDVEGRPLRGPQADAAATLLRTHAEGRRRAIAQRQWFDPWVFELEGAAACAREAVQPWVAGFAAALDRFSGLLALDDPALIEPLAVIYAAFDPEDLLEAEDLLPTIDALEPPANMAEAVEDLVRSVLQIADVTRPQRLRAPPGPRRPAGQPT
jgi:uncharacterized protein